MTVPLNSKVQLTTELESTRVLFLLKLEKGTVTSTLEASERCWPAGASARGQLLLDLKRM